MAESEGYVIRWNPDRIRQAYELALLGANDKQIANVMGIDIMTLDYWKRTKEDFREALNNGKTIADATVANSLFKCANGYMIKKHVVHVIKGKPVVTEYEEEVGPSAWAANKWLSIRQRPNWSETHRVEVTNTNVNINKFDFNVLSTEELKLMYSIGMKQIAQGNVGDSNEN